MYSDRRRKSSHEHRLGLLTMVMVPLLLVSHAGADAPVASSFPEGPNGAPMLAASSPIQTAGISDENKGKPDELSSPILVPMEETTDVYDEEIPIRVIKPKPVSTVSAQSAGSIRFEVYNSLDQQMGGVVDWRSFGNWDPSLVVPAHGPGAQRMAGVRSQDGLVGAIGPVLQLGLSDMTPLTWHESEALRDSVSAKTGRGDPGKIKKRVIRIGKKLGAGVLWGSLSGLIVGTMLGSVGGGGAIGEGVGRLFGGVLGCSIGTTVGVSLVDPHDRSILTFVGSVSGTVMTARGWWVLRQGETRWPWPWCIHSALCATILSEFWRYPRIDSLSIGIGPNQLGQSAVVAEFRF